jgi:hypothetical protein
MLKGINLMVQSSTDLEFPSGQLLVMSRRFHALAACVGAVVCLQEFAADVDRRLEPTTDLSLRARYDLGFASYLATVEGLAPTGRDGTS